MRVRDSPRRKKPPCRACALPASEADLVTGGLLSRWSPRSLAGRFETLTRKDVTAHMRSCLVNDKEVEECHR